MTSSAEKDLRGSSDIKGQALPIFAQKFKKYNSNGGH